MRIIHSKEQVISYARKEEPDPMSYEKKKKKVHLQTGAFDAGKKCSHTFVTI